MERLDRVAVPSSPFAERASALPGPVRRASLKRRARIEPIEPPPGRSDRFDPFGSSQLMRSNRTVAPVVPARPKSLPPASSRDLLGEAGSAILKRKSAILSKIGAATPNKKDTLFEGVVRACILSVDGWRDDGSPWWIVSVLARRPSWWVDFRSRQVFF